MRTTTVSDVATNKIWHHSKHARLNSGARPLLQTGLGALLLLLTSHARADLITRQPGPFPDGKDVWYGNMYNKIAIHNDTLQIGGWGDEYDTLTRLDLSGLPQVATQAIIWLYAWPRGDSSTPTDINWYLLTSQWHSGTVTWDTRPSSVYIGYTLAPSPSGWYGVNITTSYNQWRSGNPGNLNYGLRLAPANTNNRFNMFYSSGNTAAWGRPLLYVYYTPQTNDSILKLKWPLATAYASRYPTSRFGDDWVRDCGSLIKKHNGTDFRASAGTGVYAAEDGSIREVLSPSQTGGWASNIVLEHTSPTGGKYTTVYWHVNPVTDVSSNPGGFIPKGMQIATVADLTPYGHATHFHFGVRIGTYVSGVSGTGALPQTNCGGYPAFPSGFIDSNDTNNVLFQ